MSIQDETGSGALEFKKLGEKAASEHMWFSDRPATSSDSQHVEQLLIDLRQAREENKRLRGDLEDLIEMYSEKGSVLFSFIAGVVVTLLARVLLK